MVSAEAKIKVTARDLTKKNIDKAQKGIGKLTQAVKTYGAELAAIFLAARKVWKITKDLTQAYIEDEKANAILNATLRATGIYTENLAGQLRTYAKEMQAVTTASKAQILEAQGIAATFTQIGTDIYPEVIERALDMSTIFGQDLQQSIIQLGKAINDPRLAEGLRRIGISMSEEQVKMIDYFLSINDLVSAQRVILDELKIEIGGAARAVGETFGGQVEIVANLIHEWKAAIGGLIKEAGGPLLDWIQEFLDISDEHNKNLETTIRILRGIGAAYATTFGFWLNYYKTIVESVQLLINTWKNLGKVIGIVFNPKKWGKGGIKEALAEIKDVVIDTAQDIGKGWEEWVVNSQKRWARVFAEDVIPVMEEITIEAQKVKKVLEDVGGSQEEEEKWLQFLAEAEKAYAESIHFTGEALRRYIEECDSAREGLAYLREEVMKVKEEKDEYAEWLKNTMIPLMIEYSERMYDMGVATADYTDYAKEAAEETLNFAFELQDALSIASLAYDTIGKGVSQYYQNQSIEAKNWYKQQKDMIENSIMDEEAKADALAALDEQMAAKESAIRTKEAQAQKKMALFGIVINTARGIAEAFPAFWKMAAIAAAGVVQAAIVSSAAIPTYQEGGIVPGYGGGDTVPALLEPGEMVIRKEIVREAQQGGGGEEVIFHIYNNIDGFRLNEYITRSIRAKQIPVYSGALTNI